MKHTIKTLILFVLFGTCISWTSCLNADNPLTPSSLAGTWNLVTFTDKIENFTATAGQPLDIGNGATLTITGTLALTETTYSFAIITTTEIQGLQTQTETETSTGTYSISGSTLTTVEDGTGETDTSTTSMSGNQLILEDSDVKMIFEKQ